MKSTRHEKPEVTHGLNLPIKGRRAPWMKTAAAVLTVVGAATWSVPSSAQASLGAALALEEIERVFWVCDHAATIDRIDPSTAITCSSLTEALKQRKFGGDFNAMLAWWRQHKETRHGALADGSGTSPPRLAQTTPQ